jgi:outer membrane protein assembly factor BamB
MLRLVPVLLAVALLASAFAAPPARAAAVTFQADPAHTGNAGEAGLRLPLRRAWALRLPGRVSYPVIAGGRAFVVRTRPRLKGSEVVAVALGSGRVLWRRDLGVEADSADLAYGEGRVVVARESYYDPGDPSAVLALAAADGRVLWEFGTGLFDGRPPVVAGGAVYLHGLRGTGVTALRVADGSLLWTARTDSGDSGSPAVAGDAVFAAVSGCPDVHRFRRSDGAEVWHRENGCHGGGGSTAVLFGDRLYVLESRRYPPGDVYDVTTGAIVGRMRADIPPVFAGRIGVFPDARRPRESSALYGHTLVARDLDSGRVRWTFRGDGYLDGAPLIAGGTVFVGSGSGRVYGVSLRRGRVAWRGSAGAPVPFPTPSGTVSGLAAAEGTLLVPALGRLVAYR